MRNRGMISVVIIAFLISLYPTGHARACCADHQTYYDVREGCVITNMGQRIGEWWHLCNGTWVGWGVRPGESCTDTIESEEECDT